MKLPYLFIILFIIGCNSTKKLEMQNDDAMRIAINQLGQMVSDPGYDSFQLDIHNFHCFGSRRVNVKFNKTASDSITLETFVKYPPNQTFESDTILKFASEELLSKLEYEKDVLPKQLLIAGGFQIITLNKDSSRVYQVRKAAGLLSLLENGKSNIAPYSK